ncbi:Small RNA 2'-O-methyltransferase [Frankliniella fusca]|uniref:Small RNA 2'-O-methyltransferase n=1 Tax=Frankliniella fusca TaxID=407009 RepID=A0AAE1LA96_9NEOP|nr:Small RNA 2'-O-methyltransferase [Frankliniella fusca]
MEKIKPTASCSGCQHQTPNKSKDWGSCGSDCHIEGPESDEPYHGRAFVDAEDNIKFYPPLYRQRYEVVREILKDKRWSPPPAKVVEFGCAELAMCSYFKQVPHIKEVIMVDIDADILDYYACRAGPLTSDYLNPRDNPLRVEVLCGSVADCDVRLLGANAVVCIELIEHLEMEIVGKLESTIFGFIQPEIAIFTTPNSDFNVLLKGMQGKFRHFDHKFEWSRQEFSDWTQKILAQYPFYQVEISGVGSPPKGSEDVGYCSQLAVFIRNHDYVPTLSEDASELYTTFRKYDHPVKEIDKRSDQEKLCSEVVYQLNRLAHFEIYQGDDDISTVPLLDLTAAVQSNIPLADIESVRSLIKPVDLIEKDGKTFILHNLNPESSLCDSEEDDHENQRSDAGANDHAHPEEDSEERWDDEDPPLWFAEPRLLADFHMGLALIDNAVNLVHERNMTQMNVLESDWMYDADTDDNSYGDDVCPIYYEDYENDGTKVDCEWRWNSSIPQQGSFSRLQIDPKESVDCVRSEDQSNQPTLISDFNTANVFAASSPLSSSNEHDLILSTNREPITDSGVDLSPLLHSSFPQDEVEDIFPCGMRSSRVNCSVTKKKDLPKSTSVEVLHLDESCTSKRSAGLEFVEFAPSTSVALCYTGQKYHDSDKIPGINLSLSSERKSLDGSLVRDVVDSCSLDFAGDSGYPNSSSLHHDVDVDLTPEQVDDISSENDERSNPSLSEDEHSDLSDRAPALLRRFIHPRHPIVPIVFENVENGDLANNNRDGEGNNAVAQLGDEREFVALVREDDMQPLLAAPVAEEIVLPNNADPFPDWLIDLLGIEEDHEKLPRVELVDDCDEGLGEDTL